jgi:hypothetical protein
MPDYCYTPPLYGYKRAHVHRWDIGSDLGRHPVAQASLGRAAGGHARRRQPCAPLA